MTDVNDYEYHRDECCERMADAYTALDKCDDTQALVMATLALTQATLANAAASWHTSENVGDLDVTIQGGVNTYTNIS